MSRLANIAKGGYFPFDENLLPIVSSYIAPAKQGGRILDPCAGEGRALDVLAKNWQLVPYANEIDDTRAAACTALFGATHATKGDLYRLRATQGAFTVLWCNPLYGEDSTGDEKRNEFAVLKHAWKWVQDRGIVLWAVYSHHLTPKAIDWLSGRITDATLLACPEKHLETYQQVVLIVRAGKPESAGIIFNDLQRQINAPEVMSLQSTARYVIPSPAEPQHFTFLPDVITPDHALRLMAEGNALHLSKFQSLLTATPEPPLEQPAVTPRGGQMGLVLAAGLFNGMILPKNGKQRQALRSVMRPVTVFVRDEYDGDPSDEQTTHRQVFHQKHETVTTLLAEDGEVTEIVGDSQMLEFIDNHKTILMNWLNEKLTPRYDFNLGELTPTLDEIRIKGQKLYPTQKHVIAACHRTLMAKHAVILVGEMGTGKTVMGASLLLSLRPKMKTGQVNIIMCPTHLVEKWQAEMMNVAPNCVISIIENIGQMAAFMHKAATDHRMSIAIISKEMAKLGEGWTPAVHWQIKRFSRWQKDDALPDKDERITILRIPRCPQCSEIVYSDSEGKTVATEKWLNQSKRQCRHCHSALWQDSRTFSAPKTGQLYASRNPRMPLADYIAARHANRIYAFIVDEMHETKSMDTGQGQAMLTFAQIAQKTIGLTGTLYGGVASSLYGIEFAVNPRMYTEFDWKNKGRMAWIKSMGILEKIIEHKATYDGDTGRFTGKRTYQREATEIAGCSPALVRWILDHTVFVGLKDFAKRLPSYEEHPVAITPSPDMRQVYDTQMTIMKDYLSTCIKNGDPTYLAAYLQSALSWMTAAYDTEKSIHRIKPVNHPPTSLLVAEFPSLGQARIYPKEAHLLSLIHEELSAGRGVAVFCRQTGEKRDLTQRLNTLILEHEPLAKPYMLSSSVNARRRADTIKAQIQKGTNILLCNPELVKTGLDLIEFPTLIFYEVSYSLYTMAQAARRAWRLIQTEPCKTYYLYYEGTMEARAVELVAKKQRAAALLSGDAAGGLSEMDSSTSGQLLTELAQCIGNDSSVTDLRALFARHQTTVESDWGVDDISDTPEQPAEPLPMEIILPRPTSPRRTKHQRAVEESREPLAHTLPDLIWTPLREAIQIPLL